MDISSRYRSLLVGVDKLLALCLLTVTAVAGCGGGSGGYTQQAPVSGAVPPQISAQPQNATATVGQTASFSVTATGTAPLSYQWMKNTAAISGATSASYTTPVTTSADNGASFTVAVSNSAGSMISSAATLTVSGGSLTAQTITFNNPGTQTVGTPLTLTATASSGLTVTFASQTTSVCTVSGTTATFVAAGTCTIQATQAGNSTFAAATAVTQSFTVNPVGLQTAATPTFSLAGGTYTSAQSVTLTCSTASSTIYYTTNGTTPTTSSSAYSSAISVSATETIEAICVATGYTNSAVASATYTINASGTYALPADRVTSWEPGVSDAPSSGAYAPAQPPSGWGGGIPARATICATLSPSGSDDTAAINNAIAACPANETVKLTTGTFVISGGGIHINNSYVTLRGSGPGPGMLGSALGTLPSASSATLLVKSDGTTNPSPVITVGGLPSLNTMWETAAFAADAVQGTNSVTLSGSPPSGLSAGEIVYVDETYDSTLTWFNTNGGQGTGGGYDGWGEGEYGVPVAQSRPIGQAMEVASISGNTVTFSTPFHKTYRVAYSAHLGRVQLSARTSWVGIESLFVTGGDGGDGGGNVVFGTASYSWAKNIESAGHGPKYGGALVHFLASFRCELRDSYVHSNQADIARISPGGAFYNIVLDSYAADNLVENNISWIANKVMVMRGTGGGNVIGYNYMDDGYGSAYPNQGETALNADHMATSHHELFEGNYSWQLGTDSRWGNSIYITWFRNWTAAQRVSAWPGISSTSTAFANPLTAYVYTSGTQLFYYEDEYNRIMAKVGSHHWWFSYVGNVFGAPSLPLLTTPRSYYKVPQTGYDYQWAGSSIPASINNSHVPIWALGVPDGSEPAFSGNGLDPSVLPVTLRDGNFDYYTGTVYWHGIGGSSQTQTTPPGAGGAAALPPSLYLTGKPAFFGAGTWPWVDGSNASNPLPGSLPAYTRFNLGTPNAIN